MTRDEPDRAIEQVTHRLMTRFHELSPNVVSTTVQCLHTQFADSRIRDFIPLLAERTAREHLTGASRGACQPAEARTGKPELTLSAHSDY